MGITFTPDQQKVINLHGRNILVSAAAGSGKTAVLVERIVQMVCREEKPVDIDRLLIVTFTNAAAAEMRERIGLALGSRLAEQPDNENLQKQATLLHNAQITTIDSFCLFVLRNNFNDIGLDPSFRIADEGELELLKQEVLSELLEDAFASGEEAFFHCVECYCPNGREQSLEKHIFDLYQFAMSYPWPEEWLEERKLDYSGAEESRDSGWMRFLLTYTGRMLRDCQETLTRARRICEEPDGPYMYGQALERELEQLEALCGKETYADYEAGIPGIVFERLPGKKDDSVSPEKREQAKELRNGVKGILQELAARYYALPWESVCARMRECSGAVGTLIDLCLTFKRRLDEKKREKNLLDFGDMEHMALNILLRRTPDKTEPTETALEYRQYFEEVLTDEYQDSNLVQEYLLKAVSREEEGEYNRFMVGDVKQSIYKFRLARPELFLEKYHTYTREDGERQRIDLHRNFRSRREVIDTVNTVFEKIMQEELGGIGYDESAALYPGASYPDNEGCESELLLMEKPDEASGINAKQMEALGIAARIKRLLLEMLVTDKDTGELRPVTYKDIVILLRTGSGWDEEFREVFGEEGIPAYVSSRTGYFAAQEIQNVMHFLHVLDNPLQDVPLFGVMKSIFGGFTEEELAVIRSCQNKELREEKKGVPYLYEGVLSYADRPQEQGADPLRTKCTAFLERLARYRGYTSYLPIRSLLQTLFTEYGYLQYVSALPAGGQRLANVEMLLEKAAAFEKTSYYGLFHFIRYMEQLERYNVDYGEANVLDENADVVRIMSIHKSKGLEFPVTFVAGLSKRFNMQDTAQPLIVDIDMGIGTDYVNPDRRLKSRTLRKNVIAVKMKLDNLAEELRILYVAMTRAKEKLILTGVLENAAGKAGVYEETRPDRLSYRELTGAGCYLEYLLPAMPVTAVYTAEELAAGRWKESIDMEGRRQSLSVAAKYADETVLALLKERLSYSYPHGGLAGLYTKTTVSELKLKAMEEKEEPSRHLFPQEEIVPYLPAFDREKEEITGAARGSAVHKVMELLDMDRPENLSAEEWAVRELERMCGCGRLKKEYREAVSAGKIAVFLDSPLAARMAAAQRKGMLHREQPFVYGIPASRLNRGEERFPEEETVLIQGIVDAYFEEEDGLVLADYKTDVIKTKEELTDRYRVQLAYYEEALKKLTGKRVKERLLYSFFLGDVVVVQDS